MYTQGFPRNMRDPVVSASVKWGNGWTPTNRPGLQTECPMSAKERNPGTGAVLWNEGNEVKREGRQGVGAP